MGKDKSNKQMQQQTGQSFELDVNQQTGATDEKSVEQAQGESTAKDAGQPAPSSDQAAQASATNQPAEGSKPSTDGEKPAETTDKPAASTGEQAAPAPTPAPAPEAPAQDPVAAPAPAAAPVAAATAPADPATPVAAQQLEAKATEAAPAASSADQLASFSVATRQALRTVVEYGQVMRRNRAIEQAAGIQQQKFLFKAILWIINGAPYTEFKAAFEFLLALFAENKTGAFTPELLHRFMANVELDPEELKAFPLLLDMMTHLADKKSRQLALKQINLSKPLQRPVTEEGKNRVVNFFSQS